MSTIDKGKTDVLTTELHLPQSSYPWQRRQKTVHTAVTF